MSVAVVGTLTMSCGGSGDSADSGKGNEADVSSSPLGRSRTVATTCERMQDIPLDDVAGFLLDKFSHGRYKGGLLLTIALEYFKSNCESVLEKVIRGGQQLFKSSPQEADLSDLASYKLVVPSAETLAISNRLMAQGHIVSARDIDALVSSLCADVKGSRKSTPADDLRNVVPDVDVRQLETIRQIHRLVVDRCSGLNTYQADGLLTSMTLFVIGNTRLTTDVVPPLVLGPTLSWSGRNSITVEWNALDWSGVRSYDMWVQTNGWWAPFLTRTQETSTVVTNVLLNNSYVFAVRATDIPGNQSGWAYTSLCLFCG